MDRLSICVSSPTALAASQRAVVGSLIDLAVTWERVGAESPTIHRLLDAVPESWEDLRLGTVAAAIRDILRAGRPVTADALVEVAKTAHVDTTWLVGVGADSVPLALAEIEAQTVAAAWEARQAAERLAAEAKDLGLRLVDAGGHSVRVTRARPRSAPPTDPPADYVPPPTDLLGWALGDYAQAAAESLGVDIAMVYVPLLSAVASAIGDARVIRLKAGYDQPPIVWTCVVARSGATKSPALEVATEAVREREREIMRANAQARRQHADTVAKWEGGPRKSRGARPEPPLTLTGLADDLTVPALAHLLIGNPRGLLVAKDELSHWFGSMDQFSRGQASDVSRYLSLHTGTMLCLDRKTGSECVRIPHPRVCIVGCIPPQTLGRYLTADYFERGLPARILFAAPPERPAKGTDATVPARLRVAMREVFGRLYALQPHMSDSGREPTAVGLTADARATYVEHYNRVGVTATEVDDHEAAAWSKLPGYAARLALVGHSARGDTGDVAGETMSAAVRLAEWFGREAVRVYRLLTEPPETTLTRRLLAFVAARGGAVTVRDVTHGFWPLRGQRGGRAVTCRLGPRWQGG